MATICVALFILLGHACSEQNVYATLVTNDDYVPGAQVLAASLDLVGSGQRKRIALVSTHVSVEGRGLLKEMRYHLLEVDTVNCHAHQNKWRPSDVDAPKLQQQLVTTCTKVHLWNLTASKVVYLDADVLVVKNIDELFDRPGFAAAPDLMPPDSFNSGVMVIEPNATQHAILLNNLNKSSNYDGGDQGFLNTFFDDWFATPAAHRLPVRYNMLQHMAWLYPPAWQSVKGPAVIHFCGSSKHKPWHIHDASKTHELLQSYVEQWWMLYSTLSIPADDL